MNRAFYSVCSEILAAAARFPAQGRGQLPEQVRAQFKADLERLVTVGRQQGLADAELAEARFAIVAFIDEQLFRALHWQGREQWRSHPLQLELYRETTAGESFFVRLKALIASQQRPVALEVYYLCLALGFRGTYAASGKADGPLLEISRAARSRLKTVLPSPEHISPHAAPRPEARAQGSAWQRVMSIAALAALMSVATVVTLHWLTERRLERALGSLAAAPSPRVVQASGSGR